jgi:hypothetical protein
VHDDFREEDDPVTQSLATDEQRARLAGEVRDRLAAKVFNQSRRRAARPTRAAGAQRAADEPATPASTRLVVFSAELLDAVIAGRKTQTRRPVRDDAARPYAAAGDTLGLAEPWAPDGRGGIRYARDRTPPAPGTTVRRWRPARFMALRAVRHRLRVTAVRVEPLDAITPDDALAEGYPHGLTLLDPLAWFRHTWDVFYGVGPFAWAARPRVWVVTFELVDATRATP